MKKLRGFTLLEIMIVVAIGSILAAVAINAYQKYMMKSKIAEGQIMLRKIVDAELTFAASPRYVSQDGSICEFFDKFLVVGMYHFDGPDGTSQYMGRPPKGKKSMTRSFFGNNPEHGGAYLTPNANGHCAGRSTGSPYRNYYSPWILGLDEPVETVFGGNHSRGSYQKPGYFLYTASFNADVATETGADLAYMVYGVADLDGSSPSENTPGGTFYASSYLFNYAYYTVLGRGIYIDSNGDPQVQPAVYTQLEQAYDSSSYTGYSGGSYY